MVYCHISHLYTSSPLVLCGDVLRCQIDCSLSPVEAGLDELGTKRSTMESQLRLMLTADLTAIEEEA